MKFLKVTVLMAAAVGSIAASSACAQSGPGTAGVDASQPPPPEALTPDIHLACHGNASFAERSSGSAFAFNNRGGSANAFGYETHRGIAEDDMFVDVVGGVGRVKLPGVMLPPIHSGDDHGWRSLDELQLGDMEITGRFEINLFNKPSISINRVTGHIDVRGLGRTGFSGECRPYDASAAARMF